MVETEKVVKNILGETEEEAKINRWNEFVRTVKKRDKDFDIL